MSILNNTTITNVSGGPPVLNVASLLLYVNMLGIPLIVVLGLVGNTVSFLVFVRTHLRFKSSSVYLAVMNVVDTGMLLSLMPAWLGWVHIDVFNSPGWCQLTVYFTYVFGFLSVWVVVSFTVERYIVVFYPLLRNVTCTRRRACGVIVVLAGVALLLYSYSLWMTGVIELQGMPTCQSLPGYQRVLLLLSGVDTLITLLIPSVALIVLNGSIAARLLTYRRRRRRTLGIPLHKHRSVPSSVPHNEPSSRPPSCSCSSVRRQQPTASGNESRTNLQMRTTRSLLIVSSVFLLLNLPSHAFRVSSFVLQMLDRPSPLSHDTLQVMHEICQLFYYINFAANFFLYVSSSTCFRGALRTLCIENGCKKPQNNAYM